MSSPATVPVANGALPVESVKEITKADLVPTHPLDSLTPEEVGKTFWHGRVNPSSVTFFHLLGLDPPSLLCPSSPCGRASQGDQGGKVRQHRDHRPSQTRRARLPGHPQRAWKARRESSQGSFAQSRDRRTFVLFIIQGVTMVMIRFRTGP